MHLKMDHKAALFCLNSPFWVAARIRILNVCLLLYGLWTRLTKNFDFWICFKTRAWVFRVWVSPTLISAFLQRHMLFTSTLHKLLWSEQMLRKCFHISALRPIFFCDRHMLGTLEILPLDASVLLHVTLGWIGLRRVLKLLISVYCHSSKTVQGGIRQNYVQRSSISHIGLIAQCPDPPWWAPHFYCI